MDKKDKKKSLKQQMLEIKEKHKILKEELNNNDNFLKINYFKKRNKSKEKPAEVLSSELLSFRNDQQSNKPSKMDSEQLSKKVSDTLIKGLNKQTDSLDNSNENIETFKKVFANKTEKELEVFETERNNLKYSNNSNSFDQEEETFFYVNDKGIKNEVKLLNKVICTLSKIENGFATFVSSNDLIFLIPSLFIPKNLNIGNTYIFKLGEVEKGENKVNRVNEIHKIYSNLDEDNNI